MNAKRERRESSEGLGKQGGDENDGRSNGTRSRNAEKARAGERERRCLPTLTPRSTTPGL